MHLLFGLPSLFIHFILIRLQHLLIHIHLLLHPFSPTSTQEKSGGYTHGCWIPEFRGNCPTWTMRCVPLIFPEVLIHQLQPRHGSTLATLDVISKDHVTPLILFDLCCALRSCRLGDVISTSRNFPAGLTDIFDIIYIYIFEKKCGCEDAFP